MSTTKFKLFMNFVLTESMIKNQQLTLIWKNPDRVSDRGFGIRAWRWPTLTWGSPTLPSAMLRFTSEFGMDSGGSTALLSSSKLVCIVSSYDVCDYAANKVGYMSFLSCSLKKRFSNEPAAADCLLLCFIQSCLITQSSLGVIWSSLTGN